MSWTCIERKRDEVYLAAQERWSRLTEEDLMDSRYEQSALAETLKHRYGLEEADAQKQVSAFLSGYR